MDTSAHHEEHGSHLHAHRHTFYRDWGGALELFESDHRGQSGLLQSVRHLG